jgi:hypothetical protein
MFMLWSRRRPRWPIDPSRVTFGSVVEDRIRNLSRSHVRVRYRRDPEEHFVPLATFIRDCRDGIQRERRLNIDDLLVAPVAKQRYAEFFDVLTDWEPAGRRARSRQRPQ